MLRSLAVFSLVVVLLCGAAKAEVVDLGTYVADTTTNLDWLKVTHLNGYSFEQVASGAGGFTNSGWRFATQDELMNLFSTYVGPQNGDYVLPTSGRSLSYLAGAEALVLLLGMNVAINDSRAVYNIADSANPFAPSSAGLHMITSQGYFDDGDSDPFHGVAELTAVLNGGYSADDPNGRWLVYPNNSAPNIQGPNVSSFLVRNSFTTPVPEPQVYFLMIAGLFMITLVSRRVGCREARPHG